MLTEAQAPSVAAEVTEALASLLRDNPAVIHRFEKTFHNRSRAAGLVESMKGMRGIEGALAELFARAFHVEKPHEGLTSHTPDEYFVAEMRGALKLLAESDALSLLMLKQNQLEEGCSLEDALEALFVDYIEREETYPY